MNTQLRQVQLTQLDILKDIDSFCKKHSINYSLYAGSLLGAVRHQGFIPWDDDLDICMERSEYDRFIHLWQLERIPGYILQNKEYAPSFTQSFTKIRKDHTTFLQWDSEAGKYHTGIFVDIFPADRRPRGFLQNKLYFFYGMLYHLFTREFVPPKSNLVVKIFSSLLLKITPPHKRPLLRSKLLAHLTRFNHDRTNPIVFIETLGSMKRLHSPDLFDSFVYLPFEDSQIMCFSKHDEQLREHFGNYWELPPEEDRAWRHHPIIINFEHNYEELNLQK